MQTGVSDLSPAPGEALSLAALDDTVEESGFELLAVELEVTGRLQQDGGSPVLVVERTQQSFHLAPGRSQAGQARWDALLELMASNAEPAKVRIDGPAKEHAAGGIELEVRSFENVE